MWSVYEFYGCLLRADDILVMTHTHSSCNANDATVRLYDVMFADDFGRRIVVNQSLYVFESGLMKSAFRCSWIGKIFHMLTNLPRCSCDCGTLQHLRFSVEHRRSKFYHTFNCIYYCDNCDFDCVSDINWRPVIAHLPEVRTELPQKIAILAIFHNTLQAILRLTRSLLYIALLAA